MKPFGIAGREQLGDRAAGVLRDEIDIGQFERVAEFHDLAVLLWRNITSSDASMACSIFDDGASQRPVRALIPADQTTMPQSLIRPTRQRDIKESEIASQPC